MPSVIRGLGNSDKVDFWIQDVKGLGRDKLIASFQNLQQQSAKSQQVSNLDKKGNDDQAVLNIKIDHRIAMANGVNVNDINRTYQPRGAVLISMTLLIVVVSNGFICKVMLLIALNLKT